VDVRAARRQEAEELIAPAARRAAAVMTPLAGPLKRQLDLDGVAYTLTLDADGLRLVEKGKRKGVELRWADLVNGDAALATALQASIPAQR
jgi:hypothetical protein